MHKKYFIILLVLSSFLLLPLSTYSQNKYSVSGYIRDIDSKEGIAYVFVSISNSQIWNTTDENGYFKIDNIPADSYVINARLLGYVPKAVKVNINQNIENLVIEMEKQTLKVDEVIITASKSEGEGSSSSYTINREALDHLQATSATDVMALLPGGKFRGDLNLTNTQTRFQVRGSDSEMGSASFGTGVEVDGVRLSTNAAMTEMRGIDSRPISLANIASIEVVTGVPSVEYGDLNNGLIKISTKRGKTPLTIDASVRPNTQMYSIQKGFSVYGGVLNSTLERAVSISNISHPFSSYDRNGLSINYNRVFFKDGGKPLRLNVGASGNVGGFDAGKDPDQKLDNYQKASNNNVRANIRLSWVPNYKWLTKIEFLGSADYSQKLNTINEYNSSTTTLANLHTTSNGYFVAQDYNTNPDADVVLGTTGSWYELSYTDDKPLYINGKLKIELNSRLNSSIYNRFMLGAEYSFSRNYGQGTFYEDPQRTPTWRPFVYNELPAMNNISLFAEDNIKINTSNNSYFNIMLGLRSDFTSIKNSEYGTINALSPRINTKYVFLEDASSWVSDLSAHVSWGKAVKLPSFNILYPRPTYFDFNSFASPSDNKNTSYLAYLTYVTQPLYNPDLLWQSSTQWETGAKTRIFGTEISVLFFKNTLNNNYTKTYTYHPFSHSYTSPASLWELPIPSENRIYSTDKETGIITVSDKTGKLPSQQLDYVTYNKFSAKMQYTNATPIERYGFEWIMDIPELKAIRTKFRLDGNYYHYKGLNEQLIQGSLGSIRKGSDGSPYKYIGHYIGGMNVSNGEINNEINLNATLTTHIPEVRMIISLRFETTLMAASQNISEYSEGNRSYAIDKTGQFISDDTDIYKGDTFVITYPEYYSSWDQPGELIPFREKYIWAKENATTNPEAKHLFNDLSQLVERSNYAFLFNPQTISPYYSVNLSITKEIADIATISFYATNFLNNLQKVTSSWNGLIGGSIYNTGYIPRFYYGLSLKIKL